MRNASKLQFFTLSKGITNLNSTVVVQADNVTREGFFYVRTLTRHKSYGISNLHVLTQTRMTHFHATLIRARTNTHKGYAVTVLGIHVGLNLKYKAGEFFFVSFH